jgi:hypothetical protein
MLRIRKTQMDSLSEAMLKQFEDRMVLHLRSACPEQTRDMSEPELRVTIRQGIDSAAQYNITSEVDIRRYLECVLVYSPDFDTNPKTAWASHILNNKQLSGTEKMNQVDEYALFDFARNQL